MALFLDRCRGATLAEDEANAEEAPQLKRMRLPTRWPTGCCRARQANPERGNRRASGVPHAATPWSPRCRREGVGICRLWCIARPGL